MKDELASGHAELRLMQRARQFDRTMTELWDEGVSCEVKYKSYDEARLVPSEQVVLLKKDNTVTTVIDDLHDVTVNGSNMQEYLGGVIDDGTS